MNQPVLIDFPNNIRLAVKREDLLHPHISGNKFRKLKYNILQSKTDGKTCLLCGAANRDQVTQEKQHHYFFRQY